MKYTEEGKSVKWNVGLARVSVLSLAPTEDLNPRKTLFTGFLFPAVVRYHSWIRCVSSKPILQTGLPGAGLIV